MGPNERVEATLQRFDLHRADLGIERDYSFIGVDNPHNIGSAIEREKEGIEEYKANPYAIGGVPAQKRARRNPFNRRSPYGMDEKTPDWLIESPLLWKMLVTR